MISTPSKVWYLERFNMMKKLRKEDILHMQQSMVMKHVDKNTLLFFLEEKNYHVYFFKEGAINPELSLEI